MEKYEICPNCGGSKKANFGLLSGKPLIGTCPTCKRKGRRPTRKYLEEALRQAEANNAFEVAIVDELEGILKSALVHINNQNRRGIEREFEEILKKINEADPCCPGAAILKELEGYKRALELATSTDAYKYCVFNGVEKENWPYYCNKERPGENLHTNCVKCWCNYYVQKALADLEKE